MAVAWQFARLTLLINKEMINLRIDNKEIEVPAGTSLIEAARQNGIYIPSLCYNSDLPHYSSCMVCIVKDVKADKFIPSCSALAEQGMEIEATGGDVLKLRRDALSMLLSEHRAECEAPCRLVCPAGLNIPVLNRYLAASEIDKSGELAFLDMGLPASTCRLCPGYCENACRRKMIDHKIAISALVTNSSFAYKIENFRPGSNKGKNIAVVGGGSSGLITAFNLTIDGYNCEIFEKEEFAGGSIITEFEEKKFPKQLVEDEITRLLSTGIKINYKTVVNEEYITNQLIKEYDTVILASSQKPAIKGATISDSFLQFEGDTMMLKGKHIFAVGGAAKESRQIVRRMGQAKKAARGISRFLATGELKGMPKSFNSTIGRIGDNEKLEWLKECPVKSERHNEPAGIDESIREAENCLHCDCRAASGCQLRDLCSGMEIKNPGVKYTAFPIEKKVDFINRVIFEQTKCIKCGLCVRVMDNKTNDPSLCFTGRGFLSIISEPLDYSFKDISGKDIDKAIDICPTGALTRIEV